MDSGVAARGKVLSFDPIRGYGFIAPDSGGEDVFLHVNDLLGEKSKLRTGTLVEFRVEDGQRGLKASSVRIVEDVRDTEEGKPQGKAEGRTEAKTVPAAEEDDEAGDGFCDVLELGDFRRTLTEILLAAGPGLTAGQILQVRGEMEALALEYGWVETT